MKKIYKLGIIAASVQLLIGCGTPSASGSAAEKTAASETSDIVTIGTTNPLSSLNPLTQSWNFIDLYATSMQFLPLVSLDADYQAVPQLAESITTEDNLTYHIRIAEQATWSDGEPVTSDDVIWTFLKMTSPLVANTSFDFSMIKGLESGTSQPQATTIEGINKIDAKNLTIAMNRPISRNTFINNIATWIMILPSHVLQAIPDDQLVGNPWFNQPTVVSGPYRVEAFDLQHYVTYKANENYFAGAPKIKTVNIQVYDGASLVAALQAGEVDFVSPALADIPYQDRERLMSLNQITTNYADPITNEMTFFNTHNIPDERIRRAIVEAIDRETIVASLLPESGATGDGFIPKSDKNFYDAEAMQTISYDPQDARALLAEAGYDGRALEWYVNSGDSVLVNAVQIAQQNLAAVGVKVNINTVDFDTLTGTIAGSDQYDLFSVQYTITPIDYYADVNSLANMVMGQEAGSRRSWTGDFHDEQLDEVLTLTQTADEAELKQLYTQMQNIVVQKAPMFSLYFLGNAGIVSKRLANASATFFGAFHTIQNWELIR